MKFAKSICTGTGLVLLAGMFLAQANAQVTYTYTGNPFTVTPWVDPNNGTHVTVILQTPTPLPANLPWFTACPNGTTGTIAAGTAIAPLRLDVCFIATGPNGEITNWQMVSVSETPFIPPNNVCGAEGEYIESIYGSGRRNDWAGCVGPGLIYGPTFNTTNNQTSGPQGTWTNPSPANLTAALLAYVTGNNIGPGNSMVAQILRLLSSLNNNTNGLACNDLNAVVNHVRAQTEKKNGPTAEQAATIMGWVGQIAAGIPGCQVN